jgi:para-nitrobenzyl esterase
MAAVTETRSGRVEGVDTGACLVFKGIPFAAPPVDERRWLPPVRETLWDGVRDASDYGADISQNQMILEQVMGSDTRPKSEDGLFLNVWTPGLDGARPVMVWIHGGAFQFGAGSTPWYDGTKFAVNGDVVLVTINYRLGPLGFLYLAHCCNDPALAESGNLGLLDQVAALEWVQECIAAFGGDPANVTIFGESAGAGSVSTLMGMPAAQPGTLFHKVIAQSGAASWGLTREKATDRARRIADALGIDASNLAAWRAATTEQLLTASTALGMETGGDGLPFAPVHDGVVLPVPPLEAIAGGSAEGVTLLTGTNHDEFTLFNMMDPSLATIDDEGIARRVDAQYQRDGHTIVAGYRANLPDATSSDVWTAIASDTAFRIPMIEMLEAHVAHGQSFSYLFTWPTPAFGGALRSCHAVEIPFVFDNLDQPGVSMFLGAEPPQREIADPLHQAWLAFARTGKPAHETIPAWEPYDLDQRATMRIDVEWELEDDPMADERKLWK